MKHRDKCTNRLNGLAMMYMMYTMIIYNVLMLDPDDVLNKLATQTRKLRLKYVIFFEIVRN